MPKCLEQWPFLGLAEAIGDCTKLYETILLAAHTHKYIYIYVRIYNYIHNIHTACIHNYIYIYPYVCITFCVAGASTIKN